MAGTAQVTHSIVGSMVTALQQRSEDRTSGIQTRKLCPLLARKSRPLATAKSPATSVRFVGPAKQSGGPRVSPPTASVPSAREVSTQSSIAPLTTIENNLRSIVAPEELGNEAALHAALSTVNWKSKENFAEEKAIINQYVEEAQRMLGSLTDEGLISVSAYDSAWVALVPALDGSPGPQFPKVLEWIIDNQYDDGSWGLPNHFSYYDRILNSVACVVALKTWERASASVERGLQFIRECVHKMETGDETTEMTIGFEIVFPAMINLGRKLGLDLPYDSPVIKAFFAERERKLKTIPMDRVHQVTTPLLFSIEGLLEEGLDWEKLLKLQEEDGSFMSSPSASAACVMYTKDDRALAYLNTVLKDYNNTVPAVHPIDLSERMWIIDRLERLGIAHYLEKEIKDCLDYTFKFFGPNGVCWARNLSVQDLDDTSMGFRALRQHGYDVKDSVFTQFAAQDGQFFCFAGQTSEAVSGMFNFYRAAQTRFPGDVLMERGEAFARRFLENRLAKNECSDKWLRTKDIAGEVRYGLETPWFCSLPRIEHQAYIDQYGPDDVWTSNVLYAMPNQNNELYLALAKANFNLCRSIHQQDLQQTLRWNEECGLEKLAFARQNAYEAFLTAASVLPDPKLNSARLVWAQSYVMTTVLHDYFAVGVTLPDRLKFMEATKRWDPSLMDGAAEDGKITFRAFHTSVNWMIEQGSVAQGRDIGQHLHKIWVEFVESCAMEADWTASENWPTFEDYLEIALPSMAADPIVLSTQFFLGVPVSDELARDPKKLHLMKLVNRVGRLLNDIQDHKKPNAVSILLREEPACIEKQPVAKIEAVVGETMLELSREVHQESHIPRPISQLHFNMARVVQFFHRKTDALDILIHMQEGPAV